jgi:hypothetical protein
LPLNESSSPFAAPCAANSFRDVVRLRERHHIPSLPDISIRQTACCNLKRSDPLRTQCFSLRVQTVLQTTEDKACVVRPRASIAPGLKHALARGKRSASPVASPSGHGAFAPPCDPSTRPRGAHGRPALPAPSRGGKATGRWALPLWTPASGRFAAPTPTSKPSAGLHARQRFAALDPRSMEEPHG